MLRWRMDGPGIPLDVLVLTIVVIPVCIAVLLGTRAFQGMTPLVFHCRRCNREFLRRPHRSFPTACPLCHARNWNS
jgi:hypothetical protein